MFLAPQVKRLHLIVRRDLSQTMSHYLIDRIAALSNVEIHVGAEVTALEGDRATGLTAATFRNRADGSMCRLELHHLFLFIGAEPNAAWLQGCAETDAKGFVVTGKGSLPLETSMPGVFAIGDVRAGSTKRVAAAVGEGAAVVAQVHAMLAKTIGAGRTHDKLQTQSGDQKGPPERAGVRGVPENRQPVGPFAPLPNMWPRRLLRRLAPPACDGAFPRHGSPDHRGI